MVQEFKRRSTNIYWTYRCEFRDVPMVLFHNPQIKTNAIYTLEELDRVLGRSDKENLFIPIPRSVLQEARDALEGSLAIAA